MWSDDQEWERKWWSNCVNTLDEELKQLVYFARLGLLEMPSGVPGSVANRRYYFDMHGKSVLDIGGGPASFLLKCVNVTGAIVDPCGFPYWVYERYAEAKIAFYMYNAEAMNLSGFDEVWMYNVLQHVEDPQAVIKNARNAGKLLRIFDWLDQGAMPGHPHNLTEAKLNEWFGARGTVEEIDESGCKGRCYYGVF